MLKLVSRGSGWEGEGEITPGRRSQEVASLRDFLKKPVPVHNLLFGAELVIMSGKI